jgi:type IV secretory pathway VirB2 component (pilin)
MAMTEEVKQCWLIAILALLLMLAVASVASAHGEAQPASWPTPFSSRESTHS